MSRHGNIFDNVKKDSALQKERLTKPRMEVLKIVSVAQKPIGAYEILEKLGKVIESPKAPTVYRAIDFWLEKGFVHRIESLNAYVMCSAGHKHKGSQFLICDGCGQVTEAHTCELPKTLRDSLEENVFSLSSWNLEVYGTCVHCQAP